MSLRPEEVLRIKWELGVSVTLIGAEPYITYLAVFDKAIQPYIIDPSTTSTTVVVAQAPGTTIPVALTVAAIPTIAGSSNPAFLVGSTVTVDVGPAAEIVQILIVSGLTIWVTLGNAHGQNGAYPIFMSGGEQVVRDILKRLDVLKAQLTNIAPQTAGVEQVDEIRLFPASTTGSRRGSRDMFGALIQQREQARDDLGEAVGFPNLRRVKQSAMSRVEAY